MRDCEPNDSGANRPDPSHPDPDHPAPDHPAAKVADRAAELRERAAARRRIAEIFGDSMPDTTRDERDPGSSSSSSGKGDQWYRDQVPPHHG